MLTSVRSLMAASIVAGSAFLANPATAQDLGLSVSANASLASEYRFRGVDLSGGDIAIQGGVDVSHTSGIYVGAWGSSLDEDTVGFGHTELDIYGGWSTPIGDTLTLDAGVIAYLYPNAPAGDYDYVEFFGSLGFGLGPAAMSVGLAYAPEQDSLGGTDNVYVYADAGVGIPNTPLSLSGHVGYTDGFLTYTQDSEALDWSVGVDYALNETLSIGGAYVGVEDDIAPGSYDFGDDAVVLTLTAGF